jgi:hypothetical protein
MSHCELQAGDDLLALRSQIGRLAVICNVDMSHDDTVSRLLAGDYEHCHHHDREAELLRALLVLLYRLEASVSEGPRHTRTGRALAAAQRSARPPRFHGRQPACAERIIPLRKRNYRTAEVNWQDGNSWVAGSPD